MMETQRKAEKVSKSVVFEDPHIDDQIDSVKIFDRVPEENYHVKIINSNSTHDHREELQQQIVKKFNIDEGATRYGYVKRSLNEDGSPKLNNQQNSNMSPKNWKNISDTYIEKSESKPYLSLENKIN